MSEPGEDWLRQAIQDQERRNAEALAHFDSLRKQKRRVKPLATYRCPSEDRNHRDILFRVWRLPPGLLWVELGGYTVAKGRAVDLGILRRSTPRRAFPLEEQLEFVGAMTLGDSSVQVDSVVMAGCQHVEVVVSLPEVKADAEAGGISITLPDTPPRVAVRRN